MMRYFAEFNRPRGDSTRRVARALRRQGLDVLILPHRTSLEIVRPEGMPWKRFTNAIRDQLQQKNGSVLLLSESTGNAFVCSFAGNQTGAFQRQ